MMMQVQPRRRRLSSIALFGDRIERGGRLVEHEDRRIADQRARDLDALALAAAEIGAAFVDMAIVVAGPRRDVVVDGGVLQRLRADRLSVTVVDPRA